MSESLETLYVLDLDRTTFDTDAYFDITARAADHLGLLPERILRNARLHIEQTKGSFDTNAYLLDNGVSQDALEMLHDEVKRSAGPEDVLYPHAIEFLQRIPGQFISFTKGGESTQKNKLRTADLDVEPYIITDEIRKGLIISSWRQPDGSYKVTSDSGQTFEAATIVLADDKEIAHEQLLGNCSGYLITTKKPSTALPRHIRRVDNVLEIPVS